MSYAYKIPFNLFVSIWNLLRTTIPLWEDERRGPRDAKTGQPLFSEVMYKKYIDWWLGQLVAQAQTQKKETRMNASFVSKLFGPSQRVKAATAAVGAVQLTPGNVGAMEAEIRGLMGNMVFDDPTQFSRSTAMMTAEAIGEMWDEYSSLYSPETQTALAKIRQTVQRGFYNIFLTWITAGGDVIGTLPTSPNANPNWGNQLIDPDIGVSPYAVDGTGKQGAMEDLLRPIVFALIGKIASRSGGYDATLSAQIAETIPGGQGTAANWSTGVMNVNAIDVSAYDGDAVAAQVYTEGVPIPPPTLPSLQTIDDIFTMFGLHLWLTTQIGSETGVKGIARQNEMKALKATDQSFWMKTSPGGMTWSKTKLVPGSGEKTIEGDGERASFLTWMAAACKGLGSGCSFDVTTCFIPLADLVP